MNADYQILFLGDQEDDLALVGELLQKEYLPAAMTWVQGREAFQSALKGGWGFDLLLLSGGQGGLGEEEALALARRRCPELPVIMLTGRRDELQSQALLGQGATDVVSRTGMDRLAPALRRALKEARDQAALREAEAANAQLVSLLRTLLESTSEGILVVDLAGRITTYNRKFMSLCGIPEYVMAPMELPRVFQFLRDQFMDPEAFMNEVRMLGGHAGRQFLGRINRKDENALDAYGRPLVVSGETVGQVYSFAERENRARASRSRDSAVLSPYFLDAAREGRVVPWYLTEEALVISPKGAEVLGLPAERLPGDLSALEAVIAPEDTDQLRRSLEQPPEAPFELRMRRGDGSWIRTQWNVKRGPEGYRGVFIDLSGAAARLAVDGRASADQATQFNFKVKVMQEA